MFIAHRRCPGHATFDPVKGEGYWQAPNRANDLRTYFSSKGPRVVSRKVSKADWVWGLELVEAPTLESTSVQGNRIEFHYVGGMVEWYVNNAEGLDQGFTLVETGYRNSVATADDVNGDGFSDIVIGAPYSEYDLEW